jgi:hypothetical protein
MVDQPTDEELLAMLAESADDEIPLSTRTSNPTPTTQEPLE